MRPPRFPFAALVGLDTLKMALQLAALDARLSVLVRGDKGAGKTTAVRGLAGLMAGDAPFVDLPIGATEDRLLGGLDVEKALKGEPALKPGLLAAADGGVLYVDEVNLLPDHLADALLDAVASGVHVVEREGFSAVQSAGFVMVGSMNPEEGSLRPQMLDRFALAVDVVVPSDPTVRRAVVERRLLYDADPQAFVERWNEEGAQAAARLEAARARLDEIVLPGEMLDMIAERVAAHGVRSLRADLAVVRGSRALAALQGLPAVDATHVEAVLPLALAHRASPGPRDPQPPPRPPSPESDPPSETPECSGGAAAERVFASTTVPAPRLVVERSGTASGTGPRSGGEGRGVAIGARAAREPRELDVRATILHAATHAHAAARAGGRAGEERIVVDDLHERVRLPRVRTRYIFVVDSSGSHAVHERMRLVKGAAAALLEHTLGRHDDVVVIACRGAAATVLVEPSSVPADVQRALEWLPTGGRTPLAHALELAASYVTDDAVAVVVTDGHANVPSRTDDAWADAVAAAAAIRCPGVVIDSEDRDRQTGRSRRLAEAMHATYVRLGELDADTVLRIVRGTP